MKKPDTVQQATPGPHRDTAGFGRGQLPRRAGLALTVHALAGGPWGRPERFTASPANTAYGIDCLGSDPPYAHHFAL